MYVLIGTDKEVSQEFIGGDFKDYYTDSSVALFDDRKVAEKYIKDSKLKNPIRCTFGGDIIFRKNSLLRYYESTRVEEFMPDPPLPHNPTLNGCK